MIGNVIDITATAFVSLIVLLSLIACAIGGIAVLSYLFSPKTPEEQAKADEEQMAALKKWREERSNK